MVSFALTILGKNNSGDENVKKRLKDDSTVLEKDSQKILINLPKKTKVVKKLKKPAKANKKK